MVGVVGWKIKKDGSFGSKENCQAKKNLLNCNHVYCEKNSKSHG